MAQDDLVSDEALARRLALFSEGLSDIQSILALRPHLSEVRNIVVDACNALGNAKVIAEERAQPVDPINAKYQARMRRECFPTYTGVWFYPFDPKPEDVRHEDIIIGALNECRYNGHVARFLSLAEHGLKVAVMVEVMVMSEVRAGRLREDVVPLATLHALAHDWHESILGDVISIIKRCIVHVSGQPWDRIEARVQDAILVAYGIPPVPAEVVDIIALADRYALYCEAQTLKSNVFDDPRWNFKVPPEDVRAVGAIRSTEPSRELLRERFDSEIRRLVKLVGGRIPEGKIEAATNAAIAEAKAVAVEIADRALTEVKDASKRISGSWRQSVSSSTFEIPEALRDAPEFKEGR